MKILFCLIHLTIFLLLAGCNDSVLEGSISKKEKITLEFFLHKTETERIFEELIQEFEKLNPGIDVNQVIIPEGMTVLKTRIARGDTPDIFITYPIEQDYIIRAEKGYLLELTNEPFLKNIQPTIQNRYLVNGKMYGVALTQNAVGVLYNKDHFQELGLPIPETWDTFVRTLEELRSKGKTAILMPNKEANRSSIFNLNFVANEFNSSYWEKDEFSISNDKKWREVSEKILSVLSYVQPDSFRDDYYTVNRKFANGEGSMYIMGTWALSSIERVNPELNYGIFPFPATNQAENNKVLGGVDIGLAISADTKHPNAAKKFLAFLTRKENAKRLSNFEGSISTVNGVSINREEIALLSKKIKEGKSVNWPNHYWAGGTAAESDFRKYTLQFYFDRNIDSYLSNLENMFNKYHDLNEQK
ncbi:ABC transporter substrate-binding protein [Metabacillus sp. Hm71]|uniref:ABC transporter substrate-binding protein n=1 Tax=Metabacillus sp. Hm71 TaxID=3450743 RepID=UPI003F41D7A7